MNKIHIRFDLVKARFPDLYQEAETKIAGGVDKKDILGDWLNELCMRRSSGFNQIEKPEKPTEDKTGDINIDEAASIMDDL